MNENDHSCSTFAQNLCERVSFLLRWMTAKILQDKCVRSSCWEESHSAENSSWKAKAFYSNPLLSLVHGEENKKKKEGSFFLPETIHNTEIQPLTRLISDEIKMLVHNILTIIECRLTASAHHHSSENNNHKSDHVYDKQKTLDIVIHLLSKLKNELKQESETNNPSSKNYKFYFRPLSQEKENKNAMQGGVEIYNDTVLQKEFIDSEIKKDILDLLTAFTNKIIEEFKELNMSAKSKETQPDLKFRATDKINDTEKRHRLSSHIQNVDVSDFPLLKHYTSEEKITKNISDIVKATLRQSNDAEHKKSMNEINMSSNHITTSERVTQILDNVIQAAHQLENEELVSENDLRGSHKNEFNLQSASILPEPAKDKVKENVSFLVFSTSEKLMEKVSLAPKCSESSLQRYAPEMSLDLRESLERQVRLQMIGSVIDTAVNLKNNPSFHSSFVKEIEMPIDPVDVNRSSNFMDSLAEYKKSIDETNAFSVLSKHSATQRVSQIVSPLGTKERNKSIIPEKSSHVTFVIDENSPPDTSRSQASSLKGKNQQSIPHSLKSFLRKMINEVLQEKNTQDNFDIEDSRSITEYLIEKELREQINEAIMKAAEKLKSEEQFSDTRKSLPMSTTDCDFQNTTQNPHISAEPQGEVSISEIVSAKNNSTSVKKEELEYILDILMKVLNEIKKQADILIQSAELISAIDKGEYVPFEYSRHTEVQDSPKSTPNVTKSLENNYDKTHISNSAASINIEQVALSNTSAENAPEKKNNLKHKLGITPKLNRKVKINYDVLNYLSMKFKACARNTIREEITSYNLHCLQLIENLKTLMGLSPNTSNFISVTLDSNKGQKSVKISTELIILNSNKQSRKYINETSILYPNYKFPVEKLYSSHQKITEDIVLVSKKVYQKLFCKITAINHYKSEVNVINDKAKTEQSRTCILRQQLKINFQVVIFSLEKVFLLCFIFIAFIKVIIENKIQTITLNAPKVVTTNLVKNYK